MLRYNPLNAVKLNNLSQKVKFNNYIYSFKSLGYLTGIKSANNLTEKNLKKKLGLEKILHNPQ